MLRNESRGFLGQKKRKKKAPFFILLLFISALLFFRDTLACQLVSSYIGFMAKKKGERHLFFAKKTMEHGSLQIKDVSYQDAAAQIGIERIDIYCQVSLIPFKVVTHINLHSPNVTILQQGKTKKNVSPLAFLFPHRFFETVLEVRSGTFVFSDAIEKPLSFSFAQEDASGCKGHLYVSHKEQENPLFDVSIFHKNNDLMLHVNMQLSDAAFFRPLFSLYPVLSQIDLVQGSIKAKGDLTFSKETGLSALELDTSVADFHLASSSGAASMARFDVKISHAALAPAAIEAVPFWKMVSASAVFEGVDISGFSLGALQVKNARGSLVLKEDSDPLLDIAMDLSSAKALAPATWRSSGALQHDGSFWFESSLELATQKNESALFNFSLCKVEKEKYIASVDVKGADAKAVEIITSSGLMPDDVFFSAKRLEGRFLSSVESGVLTRIECSDLVVTEPSLTMHSAAIHSLASSVALSGTFYHDASNWRVEDCKMSLDGGELATSFINAKDTDIKIIYHDKQLKGASLSTSLAEGVLAISAEGPIDNVQMQLDAHMPYQPFLSLFIDGLSPSINSKETSFSTHIHATFNPSVMHAVAELVIDGPADTTAAMQMELQVPLYASGGFVPRKMHFDEMHGQLSECKISEIVYGPLLQPLFGTTTLCGDISAVASLAHGKISGHVSSDDLFWQGSGAAISLGPISSDAAAFCYDVLANKLSASVELSDAFFSENQSFLSVGNIHGRCVFEDHKLKAEDLSARIEGIDLSFSLFYDAEGLFIQTSKVEGRIEDLSSSSAMQRLLGPLMGRISGGFSLPEGGFSFFLHKGQNQWLAHYKVGVSFYDVNVALPEGVSLSGSFDATFDSSTSIASLKNTKAELLVGNSSYNINLKDFIFDPRNPNPFTLTASYLGSEILSLVGSVSLTNHLLFSFDKQATSFFSVPLNIEKAVFDVNLTPKEIKASYVLKENIRSTLSKHLLCLPLMQQSFKQSLYDKCQLLKGDIQSSFSFLSSDGLVVELSSERLHTDTYEMKDLYLQASLHNAIWTINPLKWDGVELAMTIDTAGDIIKVPHIKYKDLKRSLQASAVFNPKTLQLTVQKSSFALSADHLHIPLKDLSGEIAGSLCGVINFSDHMQLKSMQAKALFAASLKLPISSRISMDKEVDIFYDRDAGLVVNAPSLIVKDGAGQKTLSSLSFSKLHITPLFEKISLSKILLDITEDGSKAFGKIGPSVHEIFSMRKDGRWRVKGDINVSQAGLEASLALPSGDYLVGGKEYSLENPLVQLSNAAVHVRCKARVGKAMLHCDMQQDFIKDAPLYLLLKGKEEAEGLKILCKKKGLDFEPMRLEGKLMGLEMSLQKSLHIKDGSFFGYIKTDLIEADPLLPSALKDITSALKLGKGLKVQGHFSFDMQASDDFHFRGEISGDRCDLFGFRLDSLHLRADISSQKVLLEDVKIEDVAGTLSVKTCQIDKEAASGHWTLSIPLGHVKELRPSLLEEDGKRGGAKPFLLKNLSVYELQGVLGDKKSFTANGALQFSNSAKKEFSLLDIPFEMIKDLGLDLGILSPISGDADFSLKKGRCVFHELKNSYSEGRRSEFFLAPDALAYIDLDGNWNVDLKMKQHVLLKWSESLLVSIRGTLAKPKYSLKNVDGS